MKLLEAALSGPAGPLVEVLGAVPFPGEAVAAGRAADIRPVGVLLMFTLGFTVNICLTMWPLRGAVRGILRKVSRRDPATGKCHLDAASEKEWQEIEAGTSNRCITTLHNLFAVRLRAWGGPGGWGGGNPFRLKTLSSLPPPPPPSLSARAHPGPLLPQPLRV